MADKLAADARNYWIVTPEPGFVIKTQCKVVGPTPNPSKLFINVGHCPELPPPIEDLDEEVLLRKLETDPSQIKLPISVGNLENTVDKTGAKARKVDVIMSSIYYKKRVEKSEFYRQLIFMIVIPEVELKHGLVIDAKEHTILRKNKVWDQMQKQRIRKSPAECLIQEEKPSKPINFEDIEPSPALDSQNFRARIVAGRLFEVSLQPKDSSGQSVEDMTRLRVKLNDDRVVVLLDNKRALVDFYSPYRLSMENAESEFDSQDFSLTIRTSVEW